MTLLAAVFEVPDFASCHQVQVIAHNGTVEWEALREALGTRYRGECDFHHEQGNPVFSAVMALLDSPTEEKINRVVDEAAKQWSATLPGRISGLSHEIGKAFLPIQWDLRGWQSKGFTLDRWEELAKAYRGGEGITVLQTARRLAYGAFRGSVSIASMVKEMEERFGDRATDIRNCFQQVRHLLPETEPINGNVECDDRYRNAQETLAVIAKGSYSDWKRLTEGWEGCAFKVWTMALHQALNALVEAVERLTN
jgi:hypothetical protein